MTALTHRRYSRHVLDRLIDEAPIATPVFTDDHRRSLSARFRAVAASKGIEDSTRGWSSERRATPRPVPLVARDRATRLGNAALRRTVADPSLTSFAAVDVEVTDQLLRVVSGYARPWSLAAYLAQCSPSVLALVSAEAANWATQLGEAAQSITRPWTIAASDAYYDVAGARTTLRGRRDLVVAREATRVLVRVRAGAPGRSAGPGLRADLTIDALAEPSGVAAVRVIGVWPEAGVVLRVDGTMEDLRAGARDLVLTAVVAQRQRLAPAAWE